MQPNCFISLDVQHDFVQRGGRGPPLVEGTALFNILLQGMVPSLSQPCTLYTCFDNYSPAFT